MNHISWSISKFILKPFFQSAERYFQQKQQIHTRGCRTNVLTNIILGRDDRAFLGSHCLLLLMFITKNKNSKRQPNSKKCSSLGNKNTTNSIFLPRNGAPNSNSEVLRRKAFDESFP